MTTWPDYAAIGGDYAARPAPQTGRATLDDAGGATMRGALCRLATTHTERAPSRLAGRR